MKRSNMMIILFAFLVDGVFGDTEAVKSVSVMEGDPVTLYTNVTKQNRDDIMQWYFNNTRIALINGGPSTSCLYDGKDGIFRDRLKVDYETGSLTITDIRSEHAGPYEADLISSESPGKSESLNRTSKCDNTKIIPKSSNLGEIISLTVSASDSGKNKNEGLTEPQDKEMETTVPGSGLSPAVPGSGLSSGAVAGIGVGVVVGVVVLLVAAAVGCRKIDRSIFRNVMKKNQQVKQQALKDEILNERSIMV